MCNLAEDSPENQAAICQANALEKFPRLLQGGLTSSGLIIEVTQPCILNGQYLHVNSPVNLTFKAACPGRDDGDYGNLYLHTGWLEV